LMMRKVSSEERLDGEYKKNNPLFFGGAFFIALWLFRCKTSI